MHSTRHIAIAMTLVFSGAMASAQETSRYRGYVLESSLGSVIAASGARASDARTLHERPARIQELAWRAPYVSPGDSVVDPVQQIAFSFYNDALYQVIVSYDRARTEGLTNKDVIEAISSVYGEPAIAKAFARPSPPMEAFPDSLVVAWWESDESSVTLIRGAYSPEFQLILVSTSLSTRARSAIREALRLDAVEPPRQEWDRRAREASEANAARDGARTANRAAFRP